MSTWPRIAAFCLVCILAVGGCTAAPVQPTAAPAATSAPPPTATPLPSPTPEPTFVAKTLVAGIDVGGLTAAQAAEKLRTALDPLNRPLELTAADERLVLRPAELDLELPIEALLEQAWENQRVPLEVTYDKAALRVRLNELADRARAEPAIGIITATERISRTFTYTPGRTLDVEAALIEIERLLNSPKASRRATLKMVEDERIPRADFAEMEAQLSDMIPRWDGIVGFYLYDLESGETLAVNEDTVFSGASVMKVPIMLNTYVSLKSFSTKQETWMRKMITESDNFSANALLAVSINGLSSGSGTEDALLGVRQMNAMLKELGLKHTYQNMPYEASDYLIKVRGMKIERGPAQEGSPPYTEPDPMLRTTPREMSQVFLQIDACSRGEGKLLENYPTLTPKRCQEMLDRLAKNGDRTRLVAGVPEDVRVEHKSGWVEDMQSDVGIVRSPGGDYLLAVYIFRKQRGGYLADEVAAPVIAAFSRMVYTAYNPLRVEE